MWSNCVAWAYAPGAADLCICMHVLIARPEVNWYACHWILGPFDLVAWLAWTSCLDAGPMRAHGSHGLMGWLPG